MKGWGYVALVVLLVAVAWYIKKKLGAAGEKVVQAANAVNPLNHDNVFAKASNFATVKLTGDQHATLGTKIYDWFHPDTSWINKSPAVRKK